MNNEKIRAALDGMPDIFGAPGSGAHQRSQDRLLHWYDSNYKTIRQALQSCLWNFNMEEAPRNEKPILVTGGTSLSDLGSDLVELTEPVKVKWISDLEWDSNLEMNVGGWVICDYCYYQVKVYNPKAWKHINPPEGK